MEKLTETRPLRAHTVKCLHTKLFWLEVSRTRQLNKCHSFYKNIQTRRESLNLTIRSAYKIRISGVRERSQENIFLIKKWLPFSWKSMNCYTNLLISEPESNVPIHKKSRVLRISGSRDIAFTNPRERRRRQRRLSASAAYMHHYSIDIHVYKIRCERSLQMKTLTLSCDV